jgi:aconitate hydratase
MWSRSSPGNFEGRIHPLVKSSYLASPPLVVAYALAGTVHIDMADQPIGNDKDGKPVFLKDIWPSPDEVNEVMGRSISKEMYATEYGKIFEGDRLWKTMPSPTGRLLSMEPELEVRAGAAPSSRTKRVLLVWRS